jgi:hypothetical protein
MNKKLSYYLIQIMHMRTISKYEELEVTVRACAPSNSDLSNDETSLGTSQPTLGVLFFSLSPPSCKGATNTIPENDSTHTRLARLSYHSLPKLGIPTPTRESSIKIKFQQHNVTQPRCPPSPPPPSFL